MDGWIGWDLLGTLSLVHIDWFPQRGQIAGWTKPNFNRCFSKLDGWMDGWMDGLVSWMDGWMDTSTFVASAAREYPSHNISMKG
jgi:hypothetical protein